MPGCDEDGGAKERAVTESRWVVKVLRGVSVDADQIIKRLSVEEPVATYVPHGEAASERIGAV